MSLGTAFGNLGGTSAQATQGRRETGRSAVRGFGKRARRRRPIAGGQSALQAFGSPRGGADRRSIPRR